MADPQQRSSKLETKTIVVLLMSAEKFCIFNFFGSNTEITTHPRASPQAESLTASGEGIDISN